VKPRGWDITWDAQIDRRVVRLTGGGEVTDTKVAASRGDDGQVVGTPLGAWHHPETLTARGNLAP